MRVKHCVSVFLCVLLVLFSASSSFAFDTAGFYSFVNKDLIEKYGLWQKEGNLISTSQIIKQRIKDVTSDVEQKIAAGEIILPETPKSKIITSFLKKVYDERNRRFLEEQIRSMLKSEEDTVEGEVPYWDGLKKINMLLPAMADVYAMQYIINNNPKSMALKEGFSSLTNQVLEIAKFYIDNMGLSKTAKDKMEKTIDEVSFVFYGVNKDIDHIFEEIDEKNILLAIAGDGMDLYNGLCKLPYSLSTIPDVFIYNNNVYELDISASEESNHITIGPAMGVLPLVCDNKDNMLALIIYMLSHEIGHLWNCRYVLMDVKSAVWKDIRYNFPDMKEEDLQRVEELIVAGARKKLYNLHVDGFSENDILILDKNAQKILDAFSNIKTGHNISEYRKARYLIEWLILNGTNGSNGKSLDEKIAYNREKCENTSNSCTESIELVIDGKSVFQEAAADNFALEAFTRYNISKGKDIASIFLVFARFNWEVLMDRGIFLDDHPIGPYRVNIGLRLCEAYNKWAQDNHTTYQITGTVDVL